MHLSRGVSYRDSITLLAGLGVQGDAHAGATARHRSRVAKAPTQPNLRQVHLIQEELSAGIGGLGFTVRPGDLGENITTRGVDLLELSVGTLLRPGGDAVVEATGLRNPCMQIDNFRSGLLRHVACRVASIGLAALCRCVEVEAVHVGWVALRGGGWVVSHTGLTH